MKLKISLITIIFLLWANIAIAEEVQLPAETAYQKSIEILLDMGAVPSLHDKELLIIKSDPLPMKLTDKEADCGSVFGFTYLSDNRTKTSVAYQIRTSKINDKTSDVQVKIIVSGYMNVNEGNAFMNQTRDSNQVLSCTSKGILEKKFIEALSKDNQTKEVSAASSSESKASK